MEGKCELAFRSLRDFAKLLWPYVETNEYIDGWHIGVICEHLQAVSDGEIKRLMINMPPRHMKSLLTCVFWPAWHWLDDPGFAWLCSTYAMNLALRDSVKCRRIIQSPAYQFMLQQYQPDFVLVGDQNTKGRYENSLGGVRLATSVDGANTGEGGDGLVVDDAHNVKEVESETERENVVEWWDKVMSTRLNPGGHTFKVLNMQRSHEEDLPGHIMEKMEEEDGEQYEILILPARYEKKTRVSTSLDFEDPREEIDEPLWPEAFDDEDLKQLEVSLGPYDTAGQLQQRPEPHEGGLIPTEKFRFIPMLNKIHVKKSERYWDKAGTEGAGAFTVGVLMHLMDNGRFVISDVKREQMGLGRRENMIRATAEEDEREFKEYQGKRLSGVEIHVEQEPGSGGKDSAISTVQNLAGFDAHRDPVGGSDGNKVTRAKPFAAQVENENVDIVIAPWNRPYINELKMFPRGKYKDQVDASSGAFNKLNERGKVAKIWGQPRHRHRTVMRRSR